ncbi:MAG: penicillin-binding protein [Acidobacteriales bacterium]|nr:penicillin-binding protein [Terriglobales bacterium]
MIKSSLFRVLAATFLALTMVVTAPAKTSTTKKTSSAQLKSAASTKKSVSSKSRSKKSPTTVATKKKRKYVYRYSQPTYDDYNTTGDVAEGEDPVVRQAAVDALGNLNGTVLVIEPNSGRILAMVNQKLALSEGAKPCSTFKVAVGLAALSEGVVDKDEIIKVGRRKRMNLTEAIAHSNNLYFETLGRRLGFEKVSFWAQQFGLGELAGYNIEGEHLGTFPAEEPYTGGVGKMCSYGQSISMTPLQLGAMMSTIANGGTLYFLQHPTRREELDSFQPMVKRTLDIGSLVPEVEDGMMGAVEYGTARRVRLNFIEEPVMGKTGTCSENGARLGWFASYTNTDTGKLVTVVFLRGGRPILGPKAAEVTGRLFRNLYDSRYFASSSMMLHAGK